MAFFLTPYKDKPAETQLCIIGRKKISLSPRAHKFYFCLQTTRSEWKANVFLLRTVNLKETDSNSFTYTCVCPHIQTYTLLHHSIRPNHLKP